MKKTTCFQPPHATKKKHRLVKLFVATYLMVIAATLNAQLSGIVTIDNTSLPSSTNYTSFNAFAAVVNTAGVNGPLTVNVAAGSGPYNERVNFTAIPGTSAINTITINGNGNTISFNSTTSSLPHTFMLSGTDYMTVKNLNMVGTGASYALTCHLWNQSDHNSFITCTITAPTNATSAARTPVSVSGSSTSPTTAGSGGDGNTWSGCIIKGGYYGFCIYSATSAPFTTDNKVMGNTILDYYYMGILSYYVTDHIFSGNILERPTLTSLSTDYAIYLNTNVQKTIVENNMIRNQFTTSPSNASTFAGIYLATSPATGSENIIRNNIISDIKNNGQISGIYSTGSNNIMVHNTISFDDAAATAGNTNGIYNSTGPSVIKNNIITITRGGSGTKYCLNYASAANITSDNNVLYENAPAGTNAIGYFVTAFPTLSAWKGANNGAYDHLSSDVDPVYASPGTNYAPTSTVVNNMAEPIGVLTDINNVTRSTSSPDPGAIEFYNAPCFGNPGTAIITAPTQTYCAGTIVDLSFAAGVYTNSGISYQWVSSTASPLGPFTPVTGATVTGLTTSSLVNLTTYYSVLVMCAGGGTTTIPSAIVNMVLTSTNTVPYYESFETLNSQNNLPNCSWAVSSSVTAVTQTMTNPNGRVPHTGANFGMFENNPPGINYFYSNGVWLEPGITYSSSLWYLTESVGYLNWIDLSILVGQTQSPVGLMPVASTNGPASSAVHTSLSGTFTIITPGFYYVAIRATSIAGNAAYLSFDDLAVERPCSLNGPNVTLTVFSPTVCSDKPLTITATGADTYTWNTNATTSAITVTPAITTTGYTLWASKLLSGCTSTFVQNLFVKQSPVVLASANKDIVCSGSEVVLTAFGSNDVISYNWSNGVNLPTTHVNPVANTTYTVLGVNIHGCTTMDTKSISVNPLPNITVNSSAQQICKREEVTLTGNGALTYDWVANTSIIYNGNPLILNPESTAIYTITGTDANGCSNQAYHALLVNECTGINNLTRSDAQILVYPNPGNGVFTIETHAKGDKTIEVTDITGRLVLLVKTNDAKVEVDLRKFLDGVYYLLTKMESSTEVIKVVKSL